MSIPIFVVGWVNIAIAIEGSWVLLGILAVLGVLFSYYVYQKTTPPVGKGLQILLFVLRSLSVLLLLALLFHPILTLRKPFIQKPDIAVLIDHSKSLQIADAGQPRSETVRQILKEPFWQELADRYNLHYFPFSSKLDTTIIALNPDSLRFDGEGTDITSALEESKKRLLDQFYTAAILISDGIYNTGENPEFFVARYGVPVYTVGVGDPREKKDVLIQRVVTNEIAYTKNRVPVDVYIDQTGFSGKRIQVYLRHKNRVIDQQVVRLQSDGQLQKVRLYFTPDSAGFRKYRVEIPVLKGEFTGRNNFRNVVVRVLESKIRVLLLGGEPSFDFKFVRRALQADENIELTALVQKKGGGYYLQDSLTPVIKKDYQLVVLLGFPRWPVPAQLRDFLQQLLIRRKKPVFFIQGPNLYIPSLRGLQDILPFRIQTTPRILREVVVDPTFMGESSPVVMLTDSRSENKQRWNDLPPVFTYLNNFVPYANSDVLLQVAPLLSKLPYSPQYRKPILIARRIGEQKSLAFLGYGIWRWDLMMWGVGKTNETYLQFLNRAVRWLISREETKQVRITTDKLVYRSGEPVYLQAQVYEQSFQPVDNAVVRVKVEHGRNVREFVLEPVGEGKYEAQFRVFRGGDYRYYGDARRGDQFFGADSGRFSAGEFDIEFQHTRMNQEMLQKIANLTGGEYFTSDTISQLPERLQVEGRQKMQITEINLWNEWLTLALLILLLSIEWTIRRRRGML